MNNKSSFGSLKHVAVSVAQAGSLLCRRLATGVQKFLANRNSPAVAYPRISPQTSIDARGRFGFRSISSFLAAICLLAATTSQAQTQITADHFNAGATGTSSSDQLIWSNGALFATNTGYYKLSYSTSGTYNGFYNAGFTMTVLPATADNLGPVPNAPALGSFIQVKLTLISAPEGGFFDFWLTGATTPSYQLGVGDSTPLIALSDITLGAGSPGADPYGHVHGRRISTTMVGDYVVSFQLFDTSSNGADGGPIYTSPSTPFEIDFRAVDVPEPSIVALLGIGICGLAARKIQRTFSRKEKE